MKYNGQHIHIQWKILQLRKCDLVQIYLVNFFLSPYDAVIRSRDVDDMLTTLVRALVFIICLGAASFAHADSYCEDAGQVLPVSVAQYRCELAKPDFLINQANLDLAESLPGVADNSLVWDYHQLSVPQPPKKHSTQKRNYDLALTNSSRMGNLLRNDPEEAEPLYQLAIELPVEPAPCLMKGYCVDFNETVYWMLKTNPPSSRLSGWKESNLTFTAYRHHLLRA